MNDFLDLLNEIGCSKIENIDSRIVGSLAIMNPQALRAAFELVRDDVERQAREKRTRTDV